MKTWAIGLTAVVKSNVVWMRIKPSKSAKTVKKLSKGEQVNVIAGVRDANDNTWYQVKSGKNGYVPAASIVFRSYAGDGSGVVVTQDKRKRRLNWTGVVDASEGGMAIPKVYQFDYRTTLCYYNGIPRSVSSSGCNVTCISMATAYLTGNIDQTPEVMFDWAVDHKLYYGNGLGHAEMSKVAANWGVKSRWINNDEKKIITALKQGYPVIAHMGEGLFTSEGHYIMLRGVTEDGKILVNDPNSKSNSGKAFPMSRILKEVRLNSSSFMVCYPPDGAQED